MVSAAIATVVAGVWSYVLLSLAEPTGHSGKVALVAGLIAGIACYEECVARSRGKPSR